MFSVISAQQRRVRDSYNQRQNVERANAHAILDDDSCCNDEVFDNMGELTWRQIQAFLETDENVRLLLRIVARSTLSHQRYKQRILTDRHPTAGLHYPD